MRASKAAMAAILGIAVLLLLSGAGSVRATHGDLSGLYGGTLRVAVQGTLNLNPFTATDADSWKVIPLVYDSLARIDPVTLVPTPWAAESTGPVSPRPTWCTPTTSTRTSAGCHPTRR